MAVATASNIIYVGSGTYTENITVNTFSTTLIGENPANTIITNVGANSNGINLAGVNSSLAKFFNNIIAYNPIRGIYGNSITPTVAGNNLFWGNTSGNYNYTAAGTDLFTDVKFELGGGYRLQSTSLAVNAGSGTLADYNLGANNTTSVLGTEDTGVVDMGVHFTGSFSIYTLYVSKSGSDANNGLSPATAKLTIG